MFTPNGSGCIAHQQQQQQQWIDQQQQKQQQQQRNTKQQQQQQWQQKCAAPSIVNPHWLISSFPLKKASRQMSHTTENTNNYITILLLSLLLLVYCYLLLCCLSILKPVGIKDSIRLCLFACRCVVCLFVCVDCIELQFKKHDKKKVRGEYFWWE